MKRKKKRIVKQPIIENLGMDYTLDILPRTIEDNQFYYYDKKGVIRIGELLGVSKLSQKGVFKLGEQIIKRHVYNLQEDFKNGLILLNAYNPSIKYYCFNDYDNFVNAYNINIVKKNVIAKKEAKPAKYCVNTDSFFCKKTTQKLCNFKEFDNRADAVEYSRKGLINLLKHILKYEDILKKAHKDLTEYFRDILAINEKELWLRKYEVKIESLNPGDNLLMVNFIKEYEKEPLFYNFRKISGDTLSVSECVGDREKMVKLNDGSLLLKEDCQAYNPFIIKEKDYEEVKQILRIYNIREVKRIIETRLRSLRFAHDYCDAYEPFKKGVNNIWFNKKEFEADTKALPVIVEKLKNGEI